SSRTAPRALLRMTDNPKEPSQEFPMDDITKRDPIKITAEDINPRYNWVRHLPVLGTMGVDFEERVDYRRLHRYRLPRPHAGAVASGVGGLFFFHTKKIPHLSSAT